MKIITVIDELKAIVRELRSTGKTVGLVPTSGRLHEGHGALIAKAASENDCTIISIYPEHSGKKERPEHDYDGNLSADAEFAAGYGADIIFCPSMKDMYPDDFCTYVDMTGLTEELIGLTRPIHYRSYCTELCKLFNITWPDRAYFGRKDPQQLAVIRRMVRDMNFYAEIVDCDIYRDPDGLAKSSYNQHLSSSERQAALSLYKAVKKGEEVVASGERDAKTVLNAMKKIINDEPLAVIDYIKALDEKNMQAVSQLSSGNVVAMAVYIGRTRLTDNFIVK